MRKVNINKKINIRCERCCFYSNIKKLNNRGSIGRCFKKDKLVKYYNKCSDFIWDSKYITYSTDNLINSESKVFCKRCGRELTDSDSIARGFGELCYKHRLNALKKRYNRLF